LIWAWSDGDVVCKDCGLVADTILDDRVGYHEEMFDLPVPIKNPVTVEEYEFKSFVEERCNGDEVLAKKSWDIYAAIDTKPRASKRLSVKAIAVYKASHELGRGYTTDFVMSLFNGCDVKYFWDQLGSEKEETKKCDQELTRLLNSIYIIPSEKQWDILKVAKNIYQKIGDKPEIISGFQKKKVLSSICYMAICAIMKADVDKKELMDIIHISKSTLIKIEKVIQSVLKR
jgi:hypothetical protein